MSRCALVLFTLGLTSCAAVTVATDEAPSPEIRTYRGASDASAAEYLDASTIVVADDENNVLRIYDAQTGGLPLRTLDLSGFLGLSPGDESDLEGAARIGHRIYWISSHGRNRKGKATNQRDLLFATEITRTERRIELQPVGLPYRNLVSAMIEAFRQSDLGLAAAAGIDSAGRTVARRANLAPKVDGLNIEALAASPDGTRLFLGLRNPRAEIGRVKHAIVIALLDPAAVVDEGRTPSFDQPFLWNLGGDGLRSMLWSEARSAYLLISGAHDDGRQLRLWQWSGERQSPPVAVGDGSAFPRDLAVEALAEVPGTRRLLALSDDGDRRVRVGSASDCKRGAYRNDGTCQNKRLRDDGKKTFRGFEIAP